MLESWTALDLMTLSLEPVFSRGAKPGIALTFIDKFFSCCCCWLSWIKCKSVAQNSKRINRIFNFRNKTYLISYILHNANKSNFFMNAKQNIKFWFNNLCLPCILLSFSVYSTQKKGIGIRDEYDYLLFRYKLLFDIWNKRIYQTIINCITDISASK